MRRNKIPTAGNRSFYKIVLTCRWYGKYIGKAENVTRQLQEKIDTNLLKCNMWLKNIYANIK